jgi:hypothetical protein
MNDYITNMNDYITNNDTIIFSPNFYKPFNSQILLQLIKKICIKVNIK